MAKQPGAPTLTQADLVQAATRLRDELAGARQALVGSALRPVARPAVSNPLPPGWQVVWRAERGTPGFIRMAPVAAKPAAPLADLDPGERSIGLL
ncbi:MAG: hypothetical protein ABIL09_12005, partial [Gemmatimonadota bacterium]